VKRAMLANASVGLRAGLCKKSDSGEAWQPAD
jgi:hypothetical protein